MPYKKKYPYHSLDLYDCLLVIPQLISLCRPNLFLLGVPVIFSPFSIVLIFASLYQNKKKVKSFRAKWYPRVPKFSN